MKTAAASPNQNATFIRRVASPPTAFSARPIRKAETRKWRKPIPIAIGISGASPAATKSTTAEGPAIHAASSAGHHIGAGGGQMLAERALQRGGGRRVERREHHPAEQSEKDEAQANITMAATIAPTGNERMMFLPCRRSCSAARRRDHRPFRRRNKVAARAKA